MVKRILLGLALLIVLGGAGFGIYWRVTEYDRAVAGAERYFITDDTWTIIRKKPEDPRSIHAAQLAFERSFFGPQYDDWNCHHAYDEVAKGPGPILDVHPATSPDAARAAASAIVSCGDARALKWVKLPMNDIIAALPARARDRRAPDDAASKELVKLAPPVTPALFAALVALAPKSAMAEAALTAGLPPDGKPFTDPADRADPKRDARLALAVSDWIRSFSTWELYEEDSAFLARIAKLVKITLDEKVILALARSKKTPELAAAARQIIGPADVELVRRYAPGPDQAFLLGPLAGSKEAEQLLAGLHAQYKRDEVPLDRTLDEVPKTLIAMGTSAVGTLSVALGDDVWAVRDVAARALVKLDRSAYAQGLSKAIRAKKADSRDAFLALELLDQDPPELDPVFASFSLANDAVTKRSTAFLAKHSRPAQWVPALFANIAVADTFDASTVKAYAALLSGEANAPFIASALQAELDSAHGTPDRVYWLIKHLALEALTAYGTKAERGVVEKFVADKSSYDFVTTTKKNGEPPVTKTEKSYFSYDATAALKAIDERGK